MTKQAFHFIFEKVVLPISQGVFDSINDTNKLLLIDEGLLYTEYQQQKTLFRLLSNKIDYDGNQKNLLDRHKICASICVALLKINTVSIEAQNLDDKTLRLGRVAMYKETIAAAVSLGLLSFLYDNEKKIKAEESVENANFSVHYTFPPREDKTEKYEDSLVRTLYFANVCGQLNLFLIAHIFYLIERYDELAKNYQLEANEHIDQVIGEFSSKTIGSNVASKNSQAYTINT